METWEIIYFSLAALIVGFLIYKMFISGGKEETILSNDSIESIKKITPSDCRQRENMLSALELATIFPQKFVIGEFEYEKRMGIKRSFSQRRVALEEFFLENPNHPLRPERYLHFLRILRELFENPDSDLKIRAVRQFLEEDFISEIKMATIISNQCESEILFAEKLLGKPLGIKDEIANIKDFLSRMKNHPLRRKLIGQMVSDFFMIKNEGECSREGIKSLLKTLSKECDSQSYYLGGELFFKAFRISEERVKNYYLHF